MDLISSLCTELPPEPKEGGQLLERAEVAEAATKAAEAATEVCQTMQISGGTAKPMHNGPPGELLLGWSRSPRPAERNLRPLSSRLLAGASAGMVGTLGDLSAGRRRAEATLVVVVAPLAALAS